MANKRVQEFKRALILESALELFAERGFDEVTMDDIAEKAELSKATIYAYFESKNTILFSVMKHALEQVCQEQRTIIDESPNSFAALEMMITKGYWDMRRASGLVHAMMHLKGTVAVDPVWKGEMTRLLSKKVNLLAEVLEKCMRDGYLLPNDPRVLAYVLDGAIRGLCLPRLEMKLPDDDLELEQLKSVVFNGIKSLGEEKIR